MFKGIISLLEKANKVGIFTHENPDGDAMGSSYALKLCLLALGKQAEVFLVPTPDRPAYKLVCGKEESGLAIEDCDLIVAVDCAEIRRLGEYADLFSSHKNTAAIDHHITHIPFANETVVQDISSSCELVFDLLMGWGQTISKDIANNLYLGMTCDTGSFKYSSVTPKTMRTAAQLMEYGADFAKISKGVFDTKSKEYYALMKIALKQLELYFDGKVSVLYLSEEDFNKAGLDESRAGGIVTLPSSVEGVIVGVYIRDREEGSYKISLRSTDLVDVSKIAATFGGGGHVRASGYSVSGKSVKELTKDVLAEIEKQLK